MRDFEFRTTSAAAIYAAMRIAGNFVILGKEEEIMTGWMIKLLLV